MVTIKKQYQIGFEGKNWVVPHGFLHGNEDEDEQFAQMRATCAGLCALLGSPKQVKNPTLGGSKQLKQLLELRNNKQGLVVAKDALFEDKESAGSPKKKRKVEATAPEKLELELPDGSGTLSVKAAKWPREDLQVLLDQKHLELFFYFLKKEEIVFKQESRRYQKTGHFAKKNEPSESD